jgi:hypothetical protein
MPRPTRSREGRYRKILVGAVSVFVAVLTLELLGDPTGMNLS